MGEYQGDGMLLIVLVLIILLMQGDMGVKY
ncbi:hypothetical protein Halha_0947 [Halobacteroides halobius DSM 5150]|uniref:Uncharacterized protein n=1 Tax=Halobacteroides halobius (strain ATCC 35273 / DSM 5150 / MD-1) TaxID=748449 RepID=L0K9X8_HALHC|nr:hypothetical protein Halha_0947 [Halobacteroides halobius DSM 5150]